MNHYIFVIFVIFSSLFSYAAPIKIMPLGDSITEGIAEIPQNPDQNSSNYPKLPNGGVDSTLTEDRIGYRGKLWDLLKTEAYDIDFVGSKNTGNSYATSDFDTNHEGHGGAKSVFIKDNIDTWLTLNPADIILLHIGTNDGASSTPIGSDDDANQSRITTVNNVKQILNTIFTKNPNAKVFVARIIEARRVHESQHAGGAVTPENPLGLWYTKDLNDAIETMVNNHPKTLNIKMVNMESGAGLAYDVAGLPYDMQPYHTEDNKSDYHPNVNGYVKMAQKWFDEMVASGWLSSNTVDSIAPELTILGSQSITLRIGNTYIDAGASATDNVDGDISDKIMTINDVDTSKVGRYSIIYSISDAAGNASKKYRVVNVIDNPTTYVPSWYIYMKEGNKAIITPLDSVYQSTIQANGIDAEFIPQENFVSLKYKFASGKQVYITANEKAEVKTGFIHETIYDTTINSDVLFKAGTTTIMKKDTDGKIQLVTRVKLDKNESLIIGGK